MKSKPYVMGRLPDRCAIAQTFSILNSFSYSQKSLAIRSCPVRSFACARPLDPPPPPYAATFSVQMTQVSKDGSFVDEDYTLEELMKALRREELSLPPRDLKIFFRSNLEAAASTCVMPRPKAKCFLLELEHIKLICLSNKCLVLHPEQPVVRWAFMEYSFID